MATPRLCARLPLGGQDPVLALTLDTGTSRVNEADTLGVKNARPRVNEAFALGR